jgi:hypothetical protein
MNLAAIVFAILAILAELLALFGAAIGVDAAVLGLVFMACTLLCMNLPVVWARRVP